MKFLHKTRVTVMAAGAMLLASAMLIGNTQVTNAAKPFAVTETPLPPPTSTPVPATAVVPTATPRPPDNSSPAVSQTADPYVVLAGCTACMQAGQPTEFVATIGNNGDTTAVNVQLFQKVPPYFELLSVTATKGTVVITGDEYIVDIGNVDPKEVITVKISLRYREGSAAQPLNAVILRTTSGGDLETNNTGFVKCEVCQVVLPVTGGDTSTTALPGLMMLMGASLAATGTLLRRKRS